MTSWPATSIDIVMWLVPAFDWAWVTSSKKLALVRVAGRPPTPSALRVVLVAAGDEGPAGHEDEGGDGSELLQSFTHVGEHTWGAVSLSVSSRPGTAKPLARLGSTGTPGPCVVEMVTFLT